MILIHDSDTNDKTQDTVILWMKRKSCTTLDG